MILSFYIYLQYNEINTKKGDRGIFFIGGQIQRVGIASAFHKDAKFLILDPANTALDIVTEKSLISSISELKNKMTLISITNRSSTLGKCDQIIKLRNGKVVAVKLEK